MNPKDVFTAAIERSEHFLRLYELLHDKRSRGIRSDWSKKFKQLMHWPAGEQIVRVDGKNTLLVLRSATGIDRKHFQHDYVSELLRASVVSAVSALDRYLHDLVVQRSWKLLTRKEKKIPKRLRSLKLPVLATKKALERLRQSSAARPGGLVKKAIQDELHREYTFQSPDSVLVASQMIGLEDFWRKVGGAMPGKLSPSKVQESLRQISIRRNQIVHEADVIRKTKVKKLTLRNISYPEARQWVTWVKEFAHAVDKVAT